MNPLQTRLAALRRRLRLVVTFRGVSWVCAIVLLVAAAGGLLDWRLHLPSLVRALVLVGTLSGAGYVAYRFLVRPLWARNDDLSLALQVEARYPALNDSLASAVQFLEEPAGSEHSGSPSLRQRAVKRALGLAKSCDFKPVVDTRGVRAAGLSLAVAGTLAIVLALLQPQLAWTALVRLTQPFGNRDWPRQTRLQISARARVARGEAFEIQGRVFGVIPERAAVEFVFEGSAPFEQVYEITRTEGSLSGALVAHLEANRVQRSFRFQVRANDAISGWQEVEVLPPPQLLPQSPQIRLQPPAYTDLAPQDLPDGATSFDAPVGTQVTVRAATDRPVVSAWLEYPPELDSVMKVAAALSPLAAPGVMSVAAALSPLAAPEGVVWKQIPAQLESDGRAFSLDFIARISGTFALHFEDDIGLGNTRLVEIRALADPQPTVLLERPSRSQDILELLPEAEITLQVQAEDPQYALRSVYLEYRRKSEDGSGSASDPARLPLYDHESLGRAIPQLLAAFGAAAIPVPAPALHLRPQRVEIGRRWSLKELKLREGDVLTLQACADDFDDVTVDKQPGRSHEIELRIVRRTALEIALNEAQAKVQQELVRLREQQKDAIAKVIPAEAHWRNNQGELQPKHLDDLLQAEQLQQQIRARVGNKQEGLRADVARILQALRDNQLSRSGTQDRMEAVAAELERLSREELGQIEPRLTEARKENETGTKKSSPSKPEKGPLAEARKHQEEVAKTLAELLKLLEPWSSTHEVGGEARSILQDQRKLNEETMKLNKETLGKELEKLAGPEKAELVKAKELQNKLAERAGQLLEKLGRLADDKEKDGNHEEARALKEAAERGKTKDAAGNMKKAAEDISQNHLSTAGSEQEAAAKAMEEVVKALEDRREDELERLVKKMKEAEKKLDDLAEEQEKLQKKVKEAGQIADPQQREEQLKRLAREQEKLQEKAQEMVRELSRLRAERAGQALSQASGRMQQAGGRMDNGDNGEEQQDEALDRINEARQELQQARQEAEEELEREKLAKIGDHIKRLRERQLALSAEADRIDRKVSEGKQWTQGAAASQDQLVDAQAALGDEAERLAEEKLKGTKVFAHLLKKSAEAMKQASERMKERLEEARQRTKDTPLGEQATIDLPAEQAAHKEITKLQQTAVRRIDQLLDALKPEAGMVPRVAKKSEDGGQGGQGNQKTGPTGNDGNGTPPLAELKALRALQLEVNEHTKAFDKQHPDVGKLTAKEKEELQAIRQEQQEVEELFLGLTAPPEAEPDKEARRRAGEHQSTFTLVSVGLAAADDPVRDQPEGPPIRLKKKAKPQPEPGPDKKSESPKKTEPPKKPETPAKPEEAKDEDEPPNVQELEEKIKELFNRLAKNMRDVEKRLEKDPGEGTQQVERDIVSDLDELIQQSRRLQQQQQQQQQSSSSANAQKLRNQSQGSGGRTQKNRTTAKRPRPGANQQANQQKGSSSGGGNGSRDEKMSKIADVYKDIWGHLPQTLRQEMDQYSREQFMAKYNELLQQYYATIAEKGRRKSE